MRCKITALDGSTEIVERFWKEFQVSCPKINQLCSGRSSAFVSAITVCVQGLHTGECDVVAQICRSNTGTAVAREPDETATATATMIPVGIPSTVSPGSGGYFANQELTVVGGTSTETAILVVGSFKTILGQDETDYSVGELDGTFTGGSGYLVSSTITMSDGTVVVVDAISGGAVTEFTITTISSTPHTSTNDTITQSFTSAEFGTGFSMTVDVNNQGVFATTHKTVSEVVVGEYTVLPTDPVSTTGATPGGATFNIDWGVKAVAVTDGGDGYALAPAVSFGGAGGSGTTATATLTGAVVSSVTVTAPGSGFTERATVTIADPS